MAYYRHMTRIIAVSLSKGGVGKTTTAVNLAAALAYTGRRVLLVDCDTQAQAGAALGVSPRHDLADLITGAVRAEKALHQARQNLMLLAGGVGLAGVTREIARQDFGGEWLLAERLEPLNGRFDYIILDTAPGWDSLQIAIMFYVQEVLSPVLMEPMAVSGLVTYVKRLDEVRGYKARQGQALKLAYVLPTALDRRVKQSDEIMEQLKGHFGELVCSPIRYDIRASEAPAHGQHIYEYAPDGRAAADYAELTRRILNDE